MKPVLFMIGPFHVFSFGLFLSLSFILTSFLIWKYGREDLLEEELMDTFVYTTLFSLFSSRIFYILLHFKEFNTNFLKYLVVREAPGLSFFGGLFGGILFLFYYSKRRKLNILKVADIFSLSASFGLALVSIGEFLGGASYGSLSRLPWAVKVVGQTGKHHPVEIYAFFSFLLFFVVLNYLHRSKLYREREGMLSLFFLVGLSMIIFLLEFFKIASVYLYNFSLNQVIFIILAVVTIIPLFRILFLTYKKSK